MISMLYFFRDKVAGDVVMHLSVSSPRGEGGSGIGWGF